MLHSEVQTCGSIVTIGSVGIVASAFLTSQEFLKGIDWYISPITHFMIGGLLVIIAGCSLLLYYHDNSKENALNAYNFTFVIGLLLIIVAAIQTIIRFIIST